MLFCLTCCCRSTSSPPLVRHSSCGVRSRLERRADQPLLFPLFADVMREVTVYDTIEPQANYSAKVHALATFHAGGRIDEIDDPLYGSTDRGGADEIAAVTAAATVLASCCEARAALLWLRCSMLPPVLTLHSARLLFPRAGAGERHCVCGRVGGREQGRGAGGVACAARRAAIAAHRHGSHGVAQAAHAQPAQLSDNKLRSARNGCSSALSQPHLARAPPDSVRVSGRQRASSVALAAG